MNCFLALILLIVSVSAFRIKRSSKNLYEFDEDIILPQVRGLNGFVTTTIAPRKADECVVDKFTPMFFIPSDAERKEHSFEEIAISDQSCTPCSRGSQFSYLVNRNRNNVQVVGSFGCSSKVCVETIYGNRIQLTGMPTITPVGKCRETPVGKSSDQKCSIILSVAGAAHSEDIDVSLFDTESILDPTFPVVPIKGFVCGDCGRSTAYCDDPTVV